MVYLPPFKWVVKGLSAGKFQTESLPNALFLSLLRNLRATILISIDHSDSHLFYRAAFSGLTGELTEWPIVHDWKSCVPYKGTESSSLSLSTINHDKTITYRGRITIHTAKLKVSAVSLRRPRWEYLRTASLSPGSNAAEYRPIILGFA